ncbi:DUF6953 family protein [Luteolibacter sp. AS25]|uniref:DUF6953 family protein n=1 Tax=Luteolibacter sp. AS25 TaxID=3135776 RepID=UPI00398AFA56
MTADVAAKWMFDILSKDGCLYQDDVVDHLVRSKAEDLLRENADGNLALSARVLNAFRKLEPVDVVWVRPDRYWRFRVTEDEPGREARG